MNIDDPTTYVKLSLGKADNLTFPVSILTFFPKYFRRIISEMLSTDAADTALPQKDQASTTLLPAGLGD